MEYSISATLNGIPTNLNGRAIVTIQQSEKCIVRLKRWSAEEIEEATKTKGKNGMQVDRKYKIITFFKNFAHILVL